MVPLPANYAAGSRAADSVKLRMFNRYHFRRPSALDRSSDNVERMIRRKLISEDQVLMDDSEDEERNEEEAVGVPSYVDVMVSWKSSQAIRRTIYFKLVFILLQFSETNLKQCGRRNFGSGVGQEEE